VDEREKEGLDELNRDLVLRLYDDIRARGEPLTEAQGEDIMKAYEACARASDAVIAGRRRK
jgi:hypothetical protein